MSTPTIIEKTAVLTHQRLIITGQHKPFTLETITEPLPQPAAGEVRLQVQAAGLAFADLLARNGKYPGAPRTPFTPGYDVVGQVDALGAGVADLAMGQQVAAILPHFGGQAATVCLPARMCVPVPAGLDPVKAVSVVLNYLTAHRMLHVNAQVKAGERLLVHSAAGGVGTALLQLGQIAGLEMYGTASGSKLDVVAAAGATPINYRTEDFAARIRQLTGDGLDVVCDPIGGETMARSYALLRPGGRLINFGFFSAVNGNSLDFMTSFMRLFWRQMLPDGKKAMFFGSTPTHAEKDVAWYRQTLTGLLMLLANGRIDPIIGATLPLAQAAQAYTLLETGAITGKIVLV